MSIEAVVKREVSEKNIEAIARKVTPQITVLGIGGTGCNIVSSIKNKGVSEVRIFALHTNAQHLSISKADQRVLLGYKVCKGLGCEGFPGQGAKAAEESALRSVRTVL